MKKSIMILAASVSLVTLGACDSGTENAQEQQADTVRDNAEVQAELWRFRPKPWIPRQMA